MARSSASKNSKQSAAAPAVAPLSEQWWVAQRSPDWIAIRAAKRERALHELRRLLERNDRLGIIDVETADFTGGIIELALLDGGGEEQFHERFCPPPHLGISPRATAVHGITDAMVAQLPTFRDRFRAIRPLTEHLILAAYNAPFEQRVLDAECAWYGSFPRAQPTIVCLMRLYSDYVGIRAFRQGKPINRILDLKLPRAANAQHHLHNAADDCRAAFQYVIEAMQARRTIAVEDALAGIGGRTSMAAYSPAPPATTPPRVPPVPPPPQVPPA
ncbi:MAG: 3'-5' exonuclease, partial [Chloroflexaceae bacterium]|nr:3'-5' exonuclease [Chloroflexaceae bacterium]